MLNSGDTMDDKNNDNISNKSELDVLKEKLTQSGIELISKGDYLCANANLLDLKERLSKFNSYIAKPTIKHNHSGAIAAVIKRNVLRKKKEAADAKVPSLESYLTALTNHIELYNLYINERLKCRHVGIYVYPKEIVMMQYQVFFASNEQAKENFDIIDEVKKKQILEKNKGKPTIFKVMFIEREAKKKGDTTPAKSKVLKIITEADLVFNNYTLVTEFTNGVKRTEDIYPAGLYFKDNRTSEDGKLQPAGNFKGELQVSIKPEFEIIEEPTTTKEDKNDNSIEE